MVRRVHSTLKVMSSLGSVNGEVLSSCDGHNNQWEVACKCGNGAKLSSRFGNNGAITGPSGKAATERAHEHNLLVAVHPGPKSKYCQTVLSHTLRPKRVLHKAMVPR